MGRFTYVTVLLSDGKLIEYESMGRVSHDAPGARSTRRQLYRPHQEPPASERREQSGKVGAVEDHLGLLVIRGAGAARAGSGQHHQDRAAHQLAYLGAVGVDAGMDQEDGCRTAAVSIG